MITGTVYLRILLHQFVNVKHYVNVSVPIKFSQKDNTIEAFFLFNCHQFSIK